MKACIYEEFGEVDVLQIREIKAPEPKSDEVLVRILFAGVNPVDWKIRKGYLKEVMPHDFPIIPGWDGAGIVSGCGANVTEFKVGDEVFGDFNTGSVKWGTYAEFALAKEVCLAKKPATMTFQVAACLPIVSLTAWQALFEFANLQAGQAVLVHAGAGGVGGMAVQFAHMKGATVITTASSKNHEYVRTLGADSVIDYTKENVKEKLFSVFPEGVDVVLDCVGGTVCEESAQLVKKGGCLVSIVEVQAEHFSTPVCKAGFIFAYPNSEQLDEIARLITTGKIQAPKITEFPLNEAKKAQELMQTGHVSGKIILNASS